MQIIQFIRVYFNNQFLFGWLIITSLLSASQSLASPQQPNISNQQYAIENQRTIYLQAEKALQNNDIKLFQRHFDQLEHYPLKSYLKRDWLIHQLTTQKPSKKLENDIQSFLTSHNSQVVSRKLRYQWLSFLVDTNQESLFLQDYQSSSSLKLKCRYLQYKLRDGQTSKDINSEIEAIWLTGTSISKSCDPLIKVWRDSGGLTDELVWQRMVMAASKKQYSLVRYLNKFRPVSQQSSSDLLIKVMRRPKILLGLKLKQKISTQEQTIVFKGINKLAWQSPFDAIKAWELFADRITFNEAQLSQLKRSIGLSLAINAEPEAKNWLRSLDIDRDSSVDQWLLSSALLNQDWNFIDYITRQKGKQSIDANKWRYWRAISTKKTGFVKTADWLMESLASERSYYGFLAASQLNLPPELNNRPIAIDSNRIAKIENMQEAKRAKELFSLGRLTDARKEWNSLLKQTAESDLTSLAHIAHSWGWDHQSILAFAKSQQINDLKKRFPFYQLEKYQAEAKRFQIPMTWAYAITRQESAFKVDASSAAGAFGLMQLKPSTARQVVRRVAKSTENAKNKRLPSLTRHNSKTKLKSANVNIEIGIAHLKEVLDYYDGHPVLATAAYNAGKHRVDQWLKDNTISDPVLWIEQIPYRETREYVKNVLTYQQIYAILDNSSNSFIADLSKHPIPTINDSHSSLTAH